MWFETCLKNNITSIFSFSFVLLFFFLFLPCFTRDIFFVSDITVLFLFFFFGTRLVLPLFVFFFHCWCLNLLLHSMLVSSIGFVCRVLTLPIKATYVVKLWMIYFVELCAIFGTRNLLNSMCCLLYKLRKFYKLSNDCHNLSDSKFPTGVTCSDFLDCHTPCPDC